jgi:hypothetical protein
MKVQCTDSQSAEAIARYAAQYRLQDYGVSISANGNILDVAPANRLVGLLAAAFGKFFGLFLDRTEREGNQPAQAVNGKTATP